ncbi:MAG TPA: MFS transporter, partial [Candidatus Polarisedimenticolia bacterium]|nr:MFS transporter [Candidatus Polarisedimenticolia bacterium]
LGVPIGRLADRVHRPALVAAGVVLWSAATMACGFATSFARLFLMRVFVGVGEASISPAAYSLIAQVVPRERLGRALSVYMLGTVVGLGVAWIAGGQVLHWLGGAGAPVLPFLGGLGPWQMVFLIVGLPGLVVGPLLLLIHEPRRDGARSEVRLVGARVEASARSADGPSAPRGTWGGLWEQLRRGRRVYAAHFAGVAAVNTYGYALVTWAPAMFRRSFGWSMQQTGTVLGAGILLAGGAGMLGSGHLADALARRGFPDATFRILFSGTLLMAPIGILGPRIGGGAARAALFVTPAMGLFFAVVACAPTALQLVTPADLRASVSSVYLFVVNLVAFALGPLSVGWLSDRVGVDEGGLALALMILAAVCLPIGALAFGFGMAPFRRALPAPSVTTS